MKRGRHIEGSDSMAYSEDLSYILDFFKNCQEDLRFANSDVTDYDRALSDLEHELELGKRGYHEKAKIANRITEIRKERRQAKYTIEQVTPIAEWADRNQRVLKELERLLGDVRKAESHTDPQKLFYNYRTDVVQKLFDEDSVMIKGDERL
jgi:hypothetical protein